MGVWNGLRAMGRAAGVVGLALACALGGAMSGGEARAQSAEAQVMGPAPLKIAAFLRSRPNRCYVDGTDVAMRRLADLEVARINAAGGVFGRPLALTYIDDAPITPNRRDDEATTAAKDAAREAMYADIDAFLEEPDALAMIGLSSATNGERLFADRGDALRESGLPMLTDISVSEVFEENPFAFSTRPSQDLERGPAVAAFLRQRRFQRIGVIARSDALWTRSLVDAVRRRVDDSRIVADHDVSLGASRDMAAQRIEEIVADLKEKDVDAVLIAVGGRNGGPVVRALSEVNASIIAIGNLETLRERLPPGYPNPIFGLAWEQLPEISNERLRRLVSGGAPGAWIFEGAKNDSAPGWESGDCRERAVLDPEFRDPLDRRNARTIQRAAVMADMIRLAASAAIEAGPSADVLERRGAIVRALNNTYARDNGVFRGPYGNWSFNAGGRVAVQTPFIVTISPGVGRPQLAPVQFIRARGGSLKPIETLYLDVDLIRAHRVDEAARTFFAEFYLTLKATDGATIDRLDFVNAFIDPNNNGRVLTIETLHEGGPSFVYPTGMRVYRVVGRFLFEPSLRDFPFDRQRFAIRIRPKSDSDSFIVQPPPADLRDTEVRTDDWTVAQQFVSIEEDFVPITDALTHQPSLVRFYSASFVWIMDRLTTDYYLRVVVPLAVILAVAYISVFIPSGRFEAIITIQVTALLSAVALYLSLPQIDTKVATVSDRIFLFNYLLISVMIFLSIVRISQLEAKRRWLSGTLAATHMIGVPAAIAVTIAWLAGWIVL